MTSTPDAPLGSRIIDDKSPICVPFILERLTQYRKQNPDTQRPFVVGINGVQGVGKTTLVQTLYETLQDREGLETLVVSIDDFYLTHADQTALAAAHPDNALVQVRGEPGTHDTPLLASFFDAVLAGQPAHVPEYDKAAFAGKGDRAAPTPTNPGRLVNGPEQRPLQVVIVEGWCVAFRAVAPAAVEAKWQQSGASPDTKLSSKLHTHKLGHLLLVNERLAAYDAALTNHIDALIHLDAEHTPYVYDWRREQEAALRRARGTGMTDEQVEQFVDAYYPAYELFADGVRKGIFPQVEGKPGRQLRLVVGKDRRVKETIEL
ncbi:Uridine/cytidine kinase [Sporothrix brasiliensis 5110]|uniref:Uridine/cytidine kinase n=1 Tax=Sporothrix brasiliensis 5110 TaxID=1398154 RepID=A0A0C2J0B1_9PEZI|nr:Uridine/cytidine kinase [Sporothrix brasiliensis 5110]KIH94801.1 Uridine/cytidine kinase [Sporothrix brasiliensis 5110]